MQKTIRQWHLTLPLLLAAVVLRAFIPAGYMPAEPGKGLLFELCHDGLPAGFMATLAGHAHHGDHGAHQGHGSAGDCSIGHILALAFADAPDIPDIPILPAAGFIATLAMQLRLVSREFVYAPRGPPVP